ncbi:MAG: hypothetical protein GY869_09650, partial [Planctomycetes bacterium]|nr:hypothetical protein [Planctomycetota bacterium]
MVGRATRSISFVIIFFCLGFGLQAAGGDVIYVDDSAVGLNNGSSWSNAYVTLQDALAVAVGGDEIRVGQGAYWPDLGGGQSLGDRGAYFLLINGVIIRGGYAGGGAADPNEHNVTLYETILSGDLNGDDGPDFTNNGENSYHVIRGIDLDPNTILDSFTISGGNANGLSHSDKFGAGLSNYNAHPKVINCMFTGNIAVYWGGGIYGNTCNTTVTNCIFIDNSAGNGGGLCNNSGSPTIMSCTFSGNSAGQGGGIYNVTGSSPIVTYCTFSENSAVSGAGMYSDNSIPTVTNCIFIGNQATDDAGGMFNYNNSHSIVTNCIFSGNSSPDKAGGIYNRTNSDAIITNCTFSSNSANYGGGIYNWDNCDPTVANCIFWDNIATNGGQIGVDNNSSLNISYSDLEGGVGDIYVGSGSTVVDGGGNLQQDPLFVDADGADNTPGTEDDDLHLGIGSPCFETGND